jgi:hypothetical protein
LQFHQLATEQVVTTLLSHSFVQMIQRLLALKDDTLQTKLKILKSDLKLEVMGLA